jgi:hypothetical protein
MHLLLEAREMDEESENFPREPMLVGEFLCPLDTPLPRRNRHRAIISGLGLRGQSNVFLKAQGFFRILLH